MSDLILRTLHPAFKERQKNFVLSSAAAVSSTIFVVVHWIRSHSPAANWINHANTTARPFTDLFFWVMGAVGVWVCYEFLSRVFIKAWAYPFLGRWSGASSTDGYYDMNVEVTGTEITAHAYCYETLEDLLAAQKGNHESCVISTAHVEVQNSRYVPTELQASYKWSSSRSTGESRSGFVTFRPCSTSVPVRLEAMQSEWFSMGLLPGKEPHAEPRVFGSGITYFVRENSAHLLEDFGERLLPLGD